MDIDIDEHSLKANPGYLKSRKTKQMLQSSNMKF